MMLGKTYVEKGHTRDELLIMRNAVEKELLALDMLLSGKTLLDVRDATGWSAQKACAYLNRKITWIEKMQEVPGVQNTKKMDYKPIWPESLYCAVFGVKEYPDMPGDAEESVEHVLLTLGQKEREVLRERFDNFATLEVIGNGYNVTRERVRQMEAKALRQLRHPSRSKILRDGLYVFTESGEYIKAQSDITNARRLDERKRHIDETLAAELHNEMSEYLKEHVRKEMHKLLRLRSVKTLRQNMVDMLKSMIDALLSAGGEQLEQIMERDWTLPNIEDTQETEEVVLVYGVDIADLNLSIRAHNCLKRAGIETLEDLSEWSVGRLMRLRNLGRKSLVEIINVCESLGVYLKEDDEYQTA